MIIYMESRLYTTSRKFYTNHAYRINCRRSYLVKISNRIIQAVGKHIIAQDALSGRNERICIDESAHLGIVISGLEVVECGLSVLVLATTAIYTQSVPTRNRMDFVWVL